MNGTIVTANTATLFLTNPLPGETHVKIEMGTWWSAEKDMEQGEVLSFGFHDDDGEDGNTPDSKENMYYVDRLHSTRITMTNDAGDTFTAFIPLGGTPDEHILLERVQHAYRK